MSLFSFFFFFFSSRRRHTRCSRDWSSDVCSSDLVDLRAAAPRVLPLLEDQYPRAVAHHEPVPVLVERAAGGLRAVVTLGQRLHVREARDGERRDGGLRAARDHDIRLVLADSL